MRATTLKDEVRISFRTKHRFPIRERALNGLLQSRTKRIGRVSECEQSEISQNRCIYWSKSTNHWSDYCSPCKRIPMSFQTQTWRTALRS